jgi:hypothetical protein
MRRPHLDYVPHKTAGTRKANVSPAVFVWSPWSFSIHRGLKTCPVTPCLTLMLLQGDVVDDAEKLS